MLMSWFAKRREEAVAKKKVKEDARQRALSKTTEAGEGAMADAVDDGLGDVVAVALDSYSRIAVQDDAVTTRSVHQHQHHAPVQHTYVHHDPPAAPSHSTSHHSTPAHSAPAHSSYSHSSHESCTTSYDSGSSSSDSTSSSCGSSCGGGGGD